MALEAGTRVGAYEIVAKLGSGGMSEVYRAKDLTLGREVALKLLPEDWGKDPERVARFEREAQLLASLQHPNIAVIHGLERDSGRTFLVLELILGETLEERLERGPLSVEDARRIFHQVCLALEAAHGKGIIHRDLKPANAKVTAEGTVKLLDFGLGKDVRPTSPSANTATFDSGGTGTGLVLGTPAYMSPEQARGRAVGKTTDIWSFGVTLFEALTGRNPFARETIPDTVSAILNEEPTWSALPRGVPRSLEVLLRRCLTKDERQRLHDIGDARLEIEDASDEEAAGPGSSSWWWGLSLAAIVVLGALYFFARPQRVVVTVRRFAIELPATAPLSLANGGALAVSRDGTRLAYSARLGESTQLYLRALSQLDVVPIPGSEGAESPVFSPSGDTIAFFSGGKLRTLGLPGGNATTVADAPSPRGIAWIDGSPGSILFSPSSAGGLSLAPASGGSANVVTEVDRALDHRWPAALPGGGKALFTRWTEDGFDVVAVDLSSGATTDLVPNAFQPRHAPTGHLLFARDSDLYAAVFDARSLRVTSEPAVVVEDVAVDPRTGAAFYDFSSSGDLFYVRGSESASDAGRAVALLVDPRGDATALGPSRPSLQVPRLSPEGKTLVATISDGPMADLWALDLERGAWTRLTLTGDNGASAFAPDGRTVAFSSSRDGIFSIYSTLADGSGAPTRLTRGEHPRFPTSFSPDGRSLAYTELHPQTGFDIHVLSLPGGSHRTIAATPFEEAGAVFSPDGKYVAYTSDESGKKEVYVRRFPGPDGRWQVSTDSGMEPVWSSDGRRLFFRSAKALLMVEIKTDPDFEASTPRVVFDSPFDSAGGLYANYDVTADGAHFVMIRSEKERTARSIQVVLNWFVELEGRVRVSR
jgi:serine/threonine-protein kinase